MNSNKILGAIFLSISASIWGGMFVVVKVVVEYIPPVELVWLRYLIALFFLVIFGLIRGIKWRIARQDLFLIFLIGLIIAPQSWKIIDNSVPLILFQSSLE